MFDNKQQVKRSLGVLVVAAMVMVACGSESEASAVATTEATADGATATTSTVSGDAGSEGTGTGETDGASTGESSSFQIEVWADNWSAVYVNGELIGEDPVPITTERSFNAETFAFDAAYPFTVAIEAKDFKETDSGIEYIGERNQQMGDGGIIVQITDIATGEVVASTDSSWTALVIHRAPLNTDCVGDADPDATCEFESTTAPDGWVDADFDDSSWSSATVWSESDVSPKDGYDEISWDSAAELIWGSDLEVDDTVLLRTTVGS